MKPTVAIALLGALAVEAVNFAFLAPPIDVGYSPGTPWFVELIGSQWVILHLPGLLLRDRLERVFGRQQIEIVMGCRQVDVSVLLVSGYLDTALLLFVLLLCFHFIRR